MINNTRILKKVLLQSLIEIYIQKNTIHENGSWQSSKTKVSICLIIFIFLTRAKL